MTFLYKFFALAFWERSLERDLIRRLKASGVQGIAIAKNNTISIPVEYFQNSSKVQAIQNELVKAFKN